MQKAEEFVEMKKGGVRPAGRSVKPIRRVIDSSKVRLSADELDFRRYIGNQ